MSMLTVEPPAKAEAETRDKLAGRIVVRDRVIDKAVREASAVTIGISRDDVDVEVVELGGSLAVRVMARLPIPKLEDTEAVHAAGSIPQRIRKIQTELAEEVSRLTGRKIRRISFVVTGAIIPQRKRVK